MTRHAGARIDLTVAELAPAGRRIILVILAVNEGGNLAGAAGDGSRGRGEFPLVLVVNLDRLAQHRDVLGRGGPCEIRMFQQFVIPFEGGQIVAIGIAMTLRKHILGIGRIDHAVGGATARLLLDVVVGAVNHLTAQDATGVVPPQAVVGGSRTDARIDRIIAPFQER